MKKYKCPVCGYETQAEAAPQICPVCGCVSMTEESDPVIVKARK